MRLAFDYAAMITNDLGYKCKTEASSGGLVADEGVEEVFGDVGRHARAVVDDAKLERQADRRADARRLEPHARPESGRQLDLPVDGVLAHGLGCVFHEVQE